MQESKLGWAIAHFPALGAYTAGLYHDRQGLGAQLGTHGQVRGRAGVLGCPTALQTTRHDLAAAATRVKSARDMGLYRNTIFVSRLGGGGGGGGVGQSARSTQQRCDMTQRVATRRPSALRVRDQSAVCTQLGSWVCSLCTRPSFEIVHCLDNCSWTIQEHCSQVKKTKYKKNKNFVCV